MQLNQSIISDIKSIIAQSRDRAIRAVDHQRTLMYWHIGKRIFEEEQEGKDRADYGKYVKKYDNLNIDQFVECYKKYMKFSDGGPPSQKIFLKNMELKMVNKEFREDIYTILKPFVAYDNDKAYENVKTNLLEKM